MQRRLNSWSYGVISNLRASSLPIVLASWSTPRGVAAPSAGPQICAVKSAALQHDNIDSMFK
jgi:hypothetical protein